MASYTLMLPHPFPDGTSVEAYLGLEQVVGARPLGAAVDEQTMAGGAVTFSGLDLGQSYVAAAQVGGIWRAVGFSIDAPVPATLEAHIAQTQGVHGLADTADLATVADVGGRTIASASRTTNYTTTGSITYPAFDVVDGCEDEFPLAVAKSVRVEGSCYSAAGGSGSAAIMLILIDGAEVGGAMNVGASGSAGYAFALRSGVLTLDAGDHTVAAAFARLGGTTQVTAQADEKHPIEVTVQEV